MKKLLLLAILATVFVQCNTPQPTTTPTTNAMDTTTTTTTDTTRQQP
ncbi:hypothetical protein [Paracnuella aquatica]|nr:hypothetical protein [Paracnuella aquatica]